MLYFLIIHCNKMASVPESLESRIRAGKIGKAGCSRPPVKKKFSDTSQERRVGPPKMTTNVIKKVADQKIRRLKELVFGKKIK